MPFYKNRGEFLLGRIDHVASVKMPLFIDVTQDPSQVKVFNLTCIIAAETDEALQHIVSTVYPAKKIPQRICRGRPKSGEIFVRAKILHDDIISETLN